jgi:hypothetical protein
VCLRIDPQQPGRLRLDHAGLDEMVEGHGLDGQDRRAGPFALPLELGPVSGDPVLAAAGAIHHEAGLAELVRDRDGEHLHPILEVV